MLKCQTEFVSQNFSTGLLSTCVHSTVPEQEKLFANENVFENIMPGVPK
jgi:hypothetical protein